MIRCALLVLSLLLIGYSATAVPLDVRVGVFGLFHSRELIVSASGGTLSIRGDRDTCVLRGSDEARMYLDGTSIQVICPGAAFNAPAVHAIGGNGEPTALDLSVPGRISRRFHGRLEVIAAPAELVPIISMDLETAVASIVAAEQIMSAPPEALKAQAVAARSFIVAAGARHREFDFCDTTHCQFLREPPAPDHPGARAAHETAGLVLAFRGNPLAAFYSANCGGRTRTLADAKLRTGDGYPYFRVTCAVRHDAAGAGGHGIGLCQEGAGAMAAIRGTSFAEILRHYYPGTTLEKR